MGHESSEIVMARRLNPKEAHFGCSGGANVTQQLGDTMSNLRIDELTAELHADDMDKVHGGIWDYSNRLGLLGQQLEDRRNPVVVGGNGPSIEDGANYGDDSSYYPGLTPLR